MTTDTSKTTLLGLPREIRDQIIAYVLVHIEEPPLHRRYASETGAPIISANPSTDRTVISFTNLRDVNRQLHEEVADHCRAAYRPNEAKANLTFVLGGYWCCPTWTYVPALLQPGRPFDLNIQARILTTGSFQRSVPLLRSDYRILYSAINDVLRRGPSVDFARHMGMMDDTCDIKTLSISFSFRDDPYTPDTWPATATEIVRRMQLFATSGVLFPHVERFRVNISYETTKSRYLYDEDWPIEPSVDGVDVSLDDWLQKLA
ncbi:hypothetical protein LTS10_000194 [Elasticomyces elasticus]|nr:hypothetical protein LTS10_000194 [Elasticomyces elasticus]